MALQERLDLPRPLAMARPVRPVILRSERGGGIAVLGSIALRGDSSARLLLGVDGSDNGAIRFGSGAVIDVREYRSGSKALTFDDTAGGAITVNIIGTPQKSGSLILALSDLASPTDVGYVNAAGAANTIPRSDHGHAPTGFERTLLVQYAQ